MESQSLVHIGRFGNGSFGEYSGHSSAVPKLSIDGKHDVEREFGTPESLVNGGY